MLETSPFVIVIAVDFSKAFNLVRHSTLLQKYASLELPDNIYNWIENYFKHCSHSTAFQGQASNCIEVTANIVQAITLSTLIHIIRSTYNWRSGKLRSNHVCTGNSARHATKSHQYHVPGSCWSQVVLRGTSMVQLHDGSWSRRNRRLHSASGEIEKSVSQLSNLRSRHLDCGRPSVWESINGPQPPTSPTIPSWAYPAVQFASPIS